MNANSAYSAQVPNHLAWAIAVTVLTACLCCPGIAPGIVAIVFASKVGPHLERGDIGGAQEASNQAKTWCIVTSVLAGIGLLLNIVMMATGGMSSYMESLQRLQGH